MYWLLVININCIRNNCKEYSLFNYEYIAQYKALVLNFYIIYIKRIIYKYFIFNKNVFNLVLKDTTLRKLSLVI